MTGQAADHPVEEAIANGMDGDQRPLPAHGQPPQRADGAFDFAVGVGGKRGKVVRTLQHGGRLAHGIHGQRRADMNRLPPVQGRHDRRVPDGVAILLATCVVAGVEGWARAAQLRHADVVRQQRIQAFLQTPRFPRARQIEVRHLRAGVDASISTPAGMDAR